MSNDEVEQLQAQIQTMQVTMLFHYLSSLINIQFYTLLDPACNYHVVVCLFQLHIDSLQQMTERQQADIQELSDQNNMHAETINVKAEEVSTKHTNNTCHQLFL